MTDRLAFVEAELERMRKACAEAEAMRAEAQRAILEKDERLLSLCHALTTPLAVVLMRSEILLAKPADPEAIERGFRSISGAARMQAAIIDNVVEWSRMQEGATEALSVSVDLASCVQDVLRRFAFQAGERNVALRSYAEPGRWTVRGDPARLTLAIHNLVSNAVKFTPSGGTVEVSLQRRRNYISVRVSDTGAGFSSDDGARLFKPLPRSDVDPPNRTRSLRLGLLVVKWIALIHRGTISASSAGPSQGASFVLTVPSFAAPSDAGS